MGVKPSVSLNNTTVVVDKYINTAYDVVKSVADQIGNVVIVSELLTDNVSAIIHLGEFISRYYGPYAEAPLTDPFENPLQVGGMYFDTTLGQLQVYNGSVWLDVQGFKIETPTNTQILQYNSTSQEFENVDFLHNSINSKQGGTSDPDEQYYHLTEAEHTEAVRAAPLTIVTQADKSTINPLSLGTASPGVSDKWMREDAVISDQLPGTTVLADGAAAITQSDNNNSTKLATTAYVDTASDSKVADAIEDAITDVAPSQNAVHDALALKLDKTQVEVAIVSTEDNNPPSQSAVHAALALKFDKASVENLITDGVTDKVTSQDKLHSEFALKAPLESPALTGTPTAPTAAATENSTQIATTAFVTDRIAHLNLFSYKGDVTNANTNPNYPAADAGDVYIITTNIGRIGGASGPVVEIGDTLLCLSDDTPSGDHATVGANWVIGQVNLQPELFALLSGATFTGNITITGGSLEMSGTNTYFEPPSLTQAQIDALTPTGPWVVFNTTEQALQQWTRGAWGSIGSGRVIKQTLTVVATSFLYIFGTLEIEGTLDVIGTVIVAPG